MTHHFLGLEHGKGEHDGAGVVIKQHLTHEQLKPNGVKLKNAIEVVPFLKETMLTGADATYLSKGRAVSRVFWEIKEGDVDQSNKLDSKAIPKARGLHCVSGYSVTNGKSFRCRQLSCFCNACMHGQWRRCSNSAHVASWEYVTLEALDDIKEEKIDDPTYEGHHEALIGALLIWDNFFVPAPHDNNEHMEFYVLHCTHKKVGLDSPLHGKMNVCIDHLWSRGSGTKKRLESFTTTSFYTPNLRLACSPTL